MKRKQNIVRASFIVLILSWVVFELMKNNQTYPVVEEPNNNSEVEKKEVSKSVELAPDVLMSSCLANRGELWETGYLKSINYQTIFNDTIFSIHFDSIGYPNLVGKIKDGRRIEMWSRNDGASIYYGDDLPHEGWEMLPGCGTGWRLGRCRFFQEILSANVGNYSCWNNHFSLNEEINKITVEKLRSDRLSSKIKLNNIPKGVKFNLILENTEDECLAYYIDTENLLTIKRDKELVEDAKYWMIHYVSENEGVMRIGEFD